MLKIIPGSKKNIEYLKKVTEICTYILANGFCGLDLPNYIPILVRFSSHLKSHGAVRFKKGKPITILLHPKARIPSILLHELCHLNQYYGGDLKVSSEGIYWKNKYYPHNTPHYLRPWEQEAFFKTKSLLRFYHLLSMEPPK